jgi:hypothetical protein
MKVRLTGIGGERGKAKPKSKSTAPTQAELAAATKMAKDFSVRRNLLMGENVHTGGQTPKFYDARTGKELLPGDVQSPGGRLLNKVPLYVQSLEWDDKANLPYYIDEKTGDIQYVQKDLFHSPRFSPNRGKSILQQPLIASR